MKIRMLMTNTFPAKGKGYWQTVLLPTASVYRGEGYTSINFEWLFWLGTIIMMNEQALVSTNEE
jgi:hypothetical protein